MTDFKEMAKPANAARFTVQKLTTDEKNAALCAVADALVAATPSILEANAKDLENGRAKGMHEGLLDRLALNEDRIKAMAEGVREVAALPDPTGEVIERFTRPNGLQIQKVRVPMGVIGIIYESRPNVTADAFSLCFKAGNVTVLKGGSDAIASNMAIASCIRGALKQSGITPDALFLIEDTDREVTKELMRQSAWIDVLIPRGSASLIQSVVENANIPVIETGTGNCHIYIDEEADFDIALPIIVNAKTQRIGVCNAAESLVVHEAVADAFLPLFAAEMKKHNVEIRADEPARNILSDESVIPATEEDFAAEFQDYIISVKTVASLDEAIAHINRYNTGHSDAIITKNEAHAARFLNEIDAACVYANASTRFTDGFEFGFGAEIGISTQKLHARGPMGLKELTSYKYTVQGSGQTRG